MESYKRIIDILLRALACVALVSFIAANRYHVISLPNGNMCAVNNYTGKWQYVVVAVSEKITLDMIESSRDKKGENSK
jgi:hypothetical protein